MDRDGHPCVNTTLLKPRHLRVFIVAVRVYLRDMRLRSGICTCKGDHPRTLIEVIYLR